MAKVAVVVVKAVVVKAVAPAAVVRAVAPVVVVRVVAVLAVAAQPTRPARPETRQVAAEEITRQNRTACPRRPLVQGRSMRTRLSHMSFASKEASAERGSKATVSLPPLARASAAFPVARGRTSWGRMGKCTREEQRSMGPAAYARVVEKMSGRATWQRGLVATCKDPKADGTPEAAGVRWSDA